MSWEYKVVTLNKLEDVQENQLNKAGQEGWELNCVSDGLAYFERMKFEENEGIKSVEEICHCGCDEERLSTLVKCAC